jgi:non-heme chloroperoxidase
MGVHPTRDGVDIFYEDRGQRAALRLQPRLATDLGCEGSAVELVADAGYRAIAHDRRGGGRSSQP